MMRRLLLLAGLLLAPAVSFATNYYWMPTSGGNWNNGANWSLSSGGGPASAVPGPSDNAIFDAGSASTCTIDMNVVVTSMTIGTSTTMGFNGAVNTSSYTISASSIVFNTGGFYACNSTITITNGAFTIPATTAWSFNKGTSNIIFDGTSGIAINAASVFSITVPTTSSSTYLAITQVPTVTGVLDIEGSLGMRSYVYTIVGSTCIINGNVYNGAGAGGRIYIIDTTVLAGTGTISVPMLFRGPVAGVRVPARTYGADVSFYTTSATGQIILSSGTTVFTGNVVMLNSGNSTYNINALAASSITVGGQLQLQAGVGTPIVYMGTAAWNLGGIVISTGSGIVYAGTGTITTGLIQIASGTFNANSSTITVSGDIRIDSGTFNEQFSSITLAGNFYAYDTGFFVDSSSKSVLTMTGYNVYMRPAANLSHFANLNTTGWVTVLSNNFSIDYLQVVTGTMTINGSIQDYMTANSSITVPGTINGTGILNIQENCVLSGTGTISALIMFRAQTMNLTIPNRPYLGPVILDHDGAGSPTIYFGTGTYNFAGNVVIDYRLHAADTNTLFVDAATSSPTINIAGNLSDSSGLANTVGGYFVNMGSSVWTVMGNVNVTSGTWALGNSTMTIMGDVNNSSSTFAANWSSVTIYGNIITSGTWNYNAETLTMAGYNKILFNGSDGMNIANLVISSKTTRSGQTHMSSSKSLTVGPNAIFQLNQYFYSYSPSVVTINPTGSVTGASTWIMYPGDTFPSTGTITSQVEFRSQSANAVIPARNYGNGVQFTNYNASGSTYTFTIGAGTLTIVGVLALSSQAAGQNIIDFQTNAPYVSVSTVSAPSTAYGTQVMNLGSSTWNIQGYVTVSSNAYTINASSSIISMGGNFTLSSGTWNAESSSMSVATFTMSSGTYTASSSTLYVNGDFITYGSSGTYAFWIGTVTLQGASNNLNINTMAYNNGTFKWLVISGSYTLVHSAYIWGMNATTGGLLLNPGGTLNMGSGMTGSMYGDLTLTIQPGATLGGPSGQFVYYSVHSLDDSKRFGNWGTINVSTFVWNCGGADISTITATNYGGNLNILPVNAGGYTVFLGTGTLTVGKNISLVSGNTPTILDNSINSDSVYVGGDWNLSYPLDQYNPGTSTVTFTGSPQILGNTTFYNLVDATPNSTMAFAPASTTTVTNLTLTGQVGAPVVVKSSTTGQQFSLKVTGSSSANYCSVRDSWASGNTIQAYSSQNKSNNNNWIFYDDSVYTGGTGTITISNGGSGTVTYK